LYQRAPRCPRSPTRSPAEEYSHLRLRQSETGCVCLYQTGRKISSQKTTGNRSAPSQDGVRDRPVRSELRRRHRAPRATVASGSPKRAAVCTRAPLCVRTPRQENPTLPKRSHRIQQTDPHVDLSIARNKGHIGKERCVNGRTTTTTESHRERRCQRRVPTIHLPTLGHTDKVK